MTKENSIDNRRKSLHLLEVTEWIPLQQALFLQKKRSPIYAENLKFQILTDNCMFDFSEKLFRGTKILSLSINNYNYEINISCS